MKQQGQAARTQQSGTQCPPGLFRQNGRLLSQLVSAQYTQEAASGANSFLFLLSVLFPLALYHKHTSRANRNHRFRPDGLIADR